MSNPNVEKLVVGSLLVGISIVSGNALLMTVAGGIGVNWSSESLAGLWQGARSLPFAPGTALARAYERALQRSVARLKQDFEAQYGKQRDVRAFELLQACAGGVAQAEYPEGMTSADTAQQALARNLDALLHGHDERQVSWIKRRLLQTVAEGFQAEVAHDQEAWRSFHGWFIQQTAQQMGVLNHSLARVPEVLEQMADPRIFKDSFDASLAPLAAQLRDLHDNVRRIGAQSQTAPAVPSVTFNNQGMQAQTVQQSGGDMYNHSAHASAPSSSAWVINHPPVPSTASIQYEPIKPRPRAILAILAGAADTERLSLLQEARVLQDCLQPYAEQFILELLAAATIDDLSRALLRLKPRVLHFSGHGSLDGLLFERGDGRSQLVPRAAFVSELTAHKSLRCVVLNACFSQLHAADLKLGVPYVIANRSAIADPVAIEFTRGFYDALAANFDIPFAYERGCNRVRLKGLPDADLPALTEGSLA